MFYCPDQPCPESLVYSTPQQHGKETRVARTGMTTGLEQAIRAAWKPAFPFTSIDEGSKTLRYFYSWFRFVTGHGIWRRWPSDLSRRNPPAGQILRRSADSVQVRLALTSAVKKIGMVTGQTEVTAGQDVCRRLKHRPSLDPDRKET